MTVSRFVLTMFKFLVSVVLYLSIKGLLFGFADEERIIRRVEAHLIIGDLLSASEEAQKGLLSYPHSSSLYSSSIRAFAKLGKEKLAIQLWEKYHQLFPDESLSRDIVEEMAWGVLCKSSQSPSIIMREMALLAALFCQDVKGITILKQGLQDSNYAIRSLAVKFSSHHRDHQLIEEVKRLFKQEKVWSVRKEVLKGIGKMKIKSLQYELEALIASNESLQSEKAYAISSLLQLWEIPDRTHIQQLALSPHNGLRQLACDAIAHFQSLRDLDQLFYLAKDHHIDVRLKAIQAIGMLRPSQDLDAILIVARKGIEDLHPHVRISSAWLLTLYSPEEGQQIFKQLLYDKKRDISLLAAAALSTTGRYGLNLSVIEFQRHPDPYVRLNLAIGLIKQREKSLEAALHLKDMLLNEKNIWGTIEVGIFRATLNQIGKNAKESEISSESDSQVLRLELFHLLAMIQAPGTQEAIRQFLLERSFEISGIAAVSLLTEGNEESLVVVEQLLKDPQPKVRLHAALILSLWSKEEKMIETLKHEYLNQSWELKAKILEALGRVGSMQSIPFLVQVLKEPSQTLRLIGAVALIQCINH